MLTREQLLQLPCWGCWWKEGGRCYNTDHFGPLPHDEKNLVVGREITPELPGTDCPGKRGKREVLEQFFGPDIIIMSEQAKK